MINAQIDPDEPQFADSDIARAKQEIAQEKWDALDADAAEWLMDNATDWIVALVRGGDYRNAAMRRIERDCVADMASYVTTVRAIERCRGEDVAAREEA